MTAYIFIGPTLRRDEIAAVLDAVCLPPVAQGDVYRVARHRPGAIGIIDGYFSGAPSVWHKEILWALSQGIPVFGSASMGALRAAELHTFGMRGIGRIFEAYRDGTLEDDDEVAVIHGPAEVGYVAASEAMVNIRATLTRADREGVVSAVSRQMLETFAKSLFFPQRSWPAVLAGPHGVVDAELGELRQWLALGRVDQKREDALAMLAAMREALADPGPRQNEFQFEWTQFWDELVVRLAAEPTLRDGSPGLPAQRIIEELQLQGDGAYAQARARALTRLFAVLEAKRRGIDPPKGAVRENLSRLRTGLGLFKRAELDSWLTRNHLDPDSLERLTTDLARSELVVALAEPELGRHLLDELRLSGDYERLVERARRKQVVLAALGNDDAHRNEPEPNFALRRLRFFEQRLGRPMPDDLEGFVRELGFASLVDFDGALRREELYLSEVDQPGIR
jgi:hypothetical protein